MRLLLTRAEQDAARTREKLKALGHRVLLSPVIEVVGTGAEWPDGVVDAVVATSAHAFALPLPGLLPESRRLLPLFLVGARTEESARANDFHGEALVAPTGAALADEMSRRTLKARRFVYLAGRDRKVEVEAALQGMDRQVELVEVYQARPVTQPQPESVRIWRDNQMEGVLHFSRRSASLFLKMALAAGCDVARPVHFCLSEDVATPLREAHCPEIQVASEPTEAALLDLLPEPRKPAF